MNVHHLRREFEGTARYQVQRRIGAGGMGVVYAVHDRERRSTVALKTIIAITPERLEQLKREFRALADVSHPNLITYYELESSAGQWFFTMELIDGHDFLAHVRTGQTNGPCAANLGRLRAAGRQLAEGIHAIHRAGQLHCDLKPDNVLVTASGRVVILDFGLVRSLAEVNEAPGERISGTPLYMAPEQANGETLTKSADWYAVGTMLYEALAGRLPFEKSKIILQKLSADPLPLKAVVDGVPADLETLVMDLLKREPSDRPIGPEVISRIGPARAPIPIALLQRGTDAGLPFVGRRQELELLTSSFTRAGDGRPVCAHVRGQSGVGKTALVRRFLDSAEQQHALVLEGRCYEREAVPYKALDSLIDDLARCLSGRRTEEAHALVPEGAAALGRLFPVLQTVQAIALSPGDLMLDPLELRRAAFEALAQILERIASKGPLILFIDDIQWGDEDSGPFLTALLRSPHAPSLMLLFAYRTDEANASALVQSLRREKGPIVEIDLDALTPDDAMSLAKLHLRRQAPAIQDLELEQRAFEIASESRGIPFFIDILSRAATSDLPRLSEDLSLETVLLESLGDLADPTRKVLDLLAVSGRPIATEILIRSAGLADFAEHLSTLRAAQLIRVTGRGDGERIVTSHDQVREVIGASLPPELLASYHLALANALEGSDPLDPEALVFHLRGAGDLARAVKYAELAAKRAASALAFERAAELYRLVLELGPPEPAKRHELLMSLGEMLSHAGRGGEAGEVFLQAAEHTDVRRALDIRRRAAEELLISGRFERGSAVLGTVLGTVGFGFARSRWRSLINIAIFTLRTKLRGLLNYRERPESTIDPDLLTKVDVCWTVVRSIGLLDLVAGEEFALRGWLLALEAGEVRRLARAFPHRVGSTVVAPKQDVERTKMLVEALDGLAGRTDSAEAHGSQRFAKGILGFYWGDFGAALAGFKSAREYLQRSAIGSNWEACTAGCYCVAALWWLGRPTEAIELHREVVAHAEARGDRWSLMHSKIGMFGLSYLAKDDPEASRRACADAMADWPEMPVLRMQRVITNTHVALYTGDGEHAFAATEELWRDPWRHMMLRMQFYKVEQGFARGRAALASAIAGRAERLGATEKMIRLIERSGASWGEPMVHILRAGLLTVRSKPAGAIREFARAKEAADAHGLGLLASAAERRRGELIGGEEGRAAVRSVDDRLRAASIENPTRFVSMLAPMAGS